MLNKTHIAIGLFFMLFFIPQVVHLWTYIFVFALATLLPNLDRFISLKSFKLFNRNASSRKRSFLHSFTFCLLITAVLAWFIPTTAFAFFLAYGTHLVADSWTIDGIKPFWPMKYVAKGNIRQGGKIEHMIFYIFIFADIIMMWLRFL